MTAAPCILVHHEPSRQEDAIAEVRRVLAVAGEPDAIVRPSGVRGSLKVLPEGNAHEAQRAVRLVLERSPSLFRHTSQWNVVDEFVPADLDAIRHACAPLAQQLGASDSWNLQAHPKGAPYPTADLLDAIAPLLSNAPSDPDNPAKRLMLEFMGKECGVGLVDRDEACIIGPVPGDERRRPGLDTA